MRAACSLSLGTSPYESLGRTAKTHRYTEAACAIDSARRGVERLKTAATQELENATLVRFGVAGLDHIVRGLEIGEPLTDFHGVLTGVPTFVGQVAALGEKGDRGP